MLLVVTFSWRKKGLTFWNRTVPLGQNSFIFSAYNSEPKEPELQGAVEWWQGKDFGEISLLFPSRKENKCASSALDGLHLLIREQLFRAVCSSPLRGAAWSRDSVLLQWWLFLGPGWRWSVWEVAPSAESPQACPADGQFIWAPSLERWTREGWGVFVMPENGIWYVPSAQYTIKQGRHQLPFDWERESAPLSYVRGLHSWGRHSRSPVLAQPGMPSGGCDVIWLHCELSRANVGERPHCLALTITVINFCEKACLGSQ